MPINETAKSTVILDGKQAEESLKRLQVESKDLRQEMERLKKANDLSGFEKVKKEADANTKAQAALKKELFSLDKVMQNLSGSSMNQLKAAQRAITAELNRMTRGTQEYIDKSKQLKQVNAEIGKVKTEMTGAGGAAGGFFGQMKLGFSNLVAGIAIGTAVVSAIKKIITVNKEFEKSLSELSALTGATGNDLKYYQQQALEIGKSTTIGAKEAVRAFTIIGSAKPELLKNKEALAEVTKQAVALAEASGMDIPTAADNLTKALNQFTLPATDAARVINVLAAGSKEGAAAIPAITEAMVQFGTVAKNANISIEESTGLIETLAERGIVGAEAGTKLRNVLVTLQQGSDDTNPKVVGLVKAFENLGNKQLSTAEMAKIFGKENLVAAQILAESAPVINKYSKAVTGTTVAYEQQKIMTDNLDGSLKKFNNSVDSLALSFNGDGGLTKFIRGAVDVLITFVDLLAMSNQSITMIRQGVMDQSIQSVLANDRAEIDKNADAYFKSITTAIQADELRIKSGVKNMDQLKLEESIYGDYRSEVILLSKEEQKAAEDRLKMNKLSLSEGKRYIEQKKLEAEALKKSAEAGGTGAGAEVMLTELENAHKKRQLSIENQHADELLSKELFNSMMLAEDLAYLYLKLEAYKKAGKDTIDIEREIAAKQIQLNQLVADKKAKADAENDKKGEELLKGILDRGNNQHKAEEKNITDKEKADAKALEEKKRKDDEMFNITQNSAVAMGQLIGDMALNAEMTQEEFQRQMVLIALDALHSTLMLAIGETWIKQIASKGFVGVLTAAAITTMIEAAFATAKGAVSGGGKKTKQRASGKYDVIGEEDGRSYSASYAGNMRTGIYTTPTLVGERGDEIVIDGATTRNLMVNFPYVLPTIRAAMVPQHATGSNMATVSAAAAPSDTDQKNINRMIINSISRLDSTLRKGIKAGISYTNVKDGLAKGEAAEGRGSKS